MYERKIGNINIEIFPDKQDLAVRVACILSTELKSNNIADKKTVWGWAAGNSQLLTLKELVRLHKEEGLDFSNLESFMGDEMYGVSPNDPKSFNYYMHKNLFNHVNVNKDKTHLLDGTISLTLIDKYFRNYDQKITEAGDIDTQLLGISAKNGHILYNEPGCDLHSRTHLAYLDKPTREDLILKFPQNSPMYGETIGMWDILKARRRFLIAFDSEKADMVHAAIIGPRDGSNPAAYLQTRNTTFFLDEAAAFKLA